MGAGEPQYAETGGGGWKAEKGNTWVLFEALVSEYSATIRSVNAELHSHSRCIYNQLLFWLGIFSFDNGVHRKHFRAYDIFFLLPIEMDSHFKAVSEKK